MATILKCKMCGGDLKIQPGDSVAECLYCGSKQTLPNNLTDEKRANLYERANNYRLENDFDKAYAIYEQIVSEDNTDAEAHWSLVLCKYGIEYVEDPGTKKRVPTVNRAQYTSILDDNDYKQAIKYGTPEQINIYKAEAETINDIQKNILNISSKESPFDVFICYKETDSKGKRTQESVYAYQIYQNLTDKGYKVFFARVTLEDKAGEAYEPYIFAALNSAKVMIVVTTNIKNLEAVWVKNEWGRFLSIMKNDRSKKLITVYKGINPTNFPPELQYLQAMDMNNLGFMQDLERGIAKILDSKETVVINNAPIAKKKNPAPFIIAAGAAAIVIIVSIAVFLIMTKQGRVVAYESDNYVQESSEPAPVAAEEITEDTAEASFEEPVTDNVEDISEEYEEETDDSYVEGNYEYNLSQFNINNDTLEDYVNCIYPDEYIRYDSGISDFYFSYPGNMYNDVYVMENGENDYGTVIKSVNFMGSNGSELIYTLYERNDNRSFEDMTNYVHYCESSSLFGAADIMNSVKSDHGRVIVTGWKSATEDVPIYDMVNIDRNYIMQMKVILTPYTDDMDKTVKAYVVENYYRLCGFSGSTKPVRSFQEYLENN